MRKKKNNSRIILSKTSGIGITRPKYSYFVFINKEGVKTIGEKQKTIKLFFKKLDLKHTKDNS